MENRLNQRKMEKQGNQLKQIKHRHTVSNPYIYSVTFDNRVQSQSIQKSQLINQTNSTINPVYNGRDWKTNQDITFAKEAPNEVYLMKNNSTAPSNSPNKIQKIETNNRSKVITDAIPWDQKSRYNSLGRSQNIYQHSESNNGFRKYYQKKLYKDQQTECLRRDKKTYINYQQALQQQSGINSILEKERNTYLKKIPSKHGMKLSMKDMTSSNVFCFQKDIQKQASTSSTDHNSASMTPQLSQGNQSQRQQLMKLIETKLEKQKNKFIKILNQQSQISSELQQKLQKLQSEITKKEQKIDSLFYELNQSKGLLQKTIKTLTKSTQQQEDYTIRIEHLEYRLKQIMAQNQEQQLMVNQKIDKLSLKVIEIGLKFNEQHQTITQDLFNALEIVPGICSRIQNKMQINQQLTNKNWVGTLVKIKNQLGQLINQSSNQLKKSQSTESKQSLLSNSNSLEYTATFNNSPAYNPQDDEQNDQLDESRTYFIHPTQLRNFQKIIQLYKFRNQKPISCVFDQENRLQYSESGTFVFDKHGNPLKLDNNQIRYYIDRGFIICQQKFNHKISSS